MKVVKDQVEISELKEMAKKMHGGFVKAMVDIENKIMAIDAPMHADLLDFLVEQEESKAENLWGINIHPGKNKKDFIEFNSLMNIRPGLGNRSMNIEDKNLREKIKLIIDYLVIK